MAPITMNKGRLKFSRKVPFYKDNSENSALWPESCITNYQSGAVSAPYHTFS